MYRFVAIDVDDTLISSDMNISEQNQRAIQAAIQNNIFVTLATGRMFRSALPYAEELEMDIPLITYHGALIKWARSGETLYHAPLPMELTLELVKFCKQRQLHINLYINDELLVEEENEYTEYYTNIAGVPCRAVGDLENYLKDQPPTKLTIVSEEEVVGKLHKELGEIFGDQLLITQSKSKFLEITYHKANKGEAISYLADLYDVPISEVMAIGDSLNDLPMLNRAGLGVAVDNARPQLREIADVIVRSNEDSGVAEAINRFVLSETGGR